MFSNIKEKLVENRKSEYLIIPKEDYFQIYDNLNIEEAQELANIYFLSLSKKQYPKVVDIKEDMNLRSIKIDIKLEESNTVGNNLV